MVARRSLKDVEPAMQNPWHTTFEHQPGVTSYYLVKLRVLTNVDLSLEEKQKVPSGDLARTSPKAEWPL